MSYFFHVGTLYTTWHQGIQHPLRDDHSWNYLARSASNITPVSCNQTQGTLRAQVQDRETAQQVQVQDRETAQVVIRLATQVPQFWHKSIKVDQGDSRRAPTKNTRSGDEFPPDRCQYLRTVKFIIDSSPPRRLQHALPTGTQGEERTSSVHEIGVPPPP